MVFRTRNRLPGLIVTLVLLAGVRAVAAQTVLLHEDFESGGSERWVERGFPSIDRKNEFAVVTDADGNRHLRAQSDRSTSGRGVRLGVDPGRCHDVSWRWRVSNVVDAADLNTPEGDDSAAKMYVIFDGPSRWNPLDKRLLTYVWDNRLPPGTVIPNAWEPEWARMIVLRSGAKSAGEWVGETVDLLRDYRRAFPGESPGLVEAVAFSADTDNTGACVTADFDDIEIRCAAEAGE